jgi:hypothetical protein
MKIFSKLFGIIAFVMVLGLILVSCGGGKSAFVGRWYLVEGSGSSIPDDVELLKDGTGFAMESEITWKTEKDRFYITHPSLAMAFNYKLSGSRLELTDDKGNRFVYVNKLGGDSAFLGTWELVSIDGETVQSAYDSVFNKDGTRDFVSDGETRATGKWVAENGVLYSINPDQHRFKSKYKIEGSTLTLTSPNDDDDGDTEIAVLKKK